jgi:hypothetical protein
MEQGDDIMTSPDMLDAWLDTLLHEHGNVDIADDGFTARVVTRVAREHSQWLAARAWAQLHATREREAHRARWTVGGAGVGLAAAGALAARADIAGLWAATPPDVAAAAVLAVVIAGAMLAQCLAQED